MLELSLGHYQEAARRAFRAHKEPPVLTLASEVDVMVESAARCGDREAASSVLEAFASRAQACGTHWALGLLARSRALLAADEDAEADYRLAIDHLRQCRIAPQLARSYQLYGEWLRRQRRRREARDQLRTAGQMFEAMDMDRFAERARAELLATGERARRRSVETEQMLTPQEAQIGRLASEGASNREIAARLFIGASTVEYHLRKVYLKLGVTSRVQTRARVAGPGRGMKPGLETPQPQAMSRCPLRGAWRVGGPAVRSGGGRGGRPAARRGEGASRRRSGRPGWPGRRIRGGRRPGSAGR